MEAESQGAANEKGIEERFVDGNSAPPILSGDSALADHDDTHDGNRVEVAAECKRPIPFDENYYEIEAVRRRRIHKGQAQYLIKWRGWPETANTWEPIENLLQCSDVIHAFEERFRKQRKRGRKSGASIVQPKKDKLQKGFSLTSNTTVPSENDETMSSGLINNMNFADPRVSQEHGADPNFSQDHSADPRVSQEHNPDPNVSQEHNPDPNVSQEHSPNPNVSQEHNTHPHVSQEHGIPVSPAGENHTGDANSPGTAKPVDENGVMNSVERETENELQETKASTDMVVTNRCTGSKRRKSGHVKRFKQDLDPCARIEIQDVITSRRATGSHRRHDRIGENSDSMVYGSKKKFSITEIIKPIGYSASASSSARDVLLTFTAMRCDGKEVTVDNNYLKANNPLLLIKFYEQHLRYNAPA